jgi:hypothetical protein
MSDDPPPVAGSVLAVLVAAFGVYAWTASPALGWLDAPQFVAAGASLGVAQSPGHPLAGLLGRLATLFPVGDAAFRVNLLSAACAAAAAAAVCVAARELLRQVAPALSARARAAAAAAAALVVAFAAAAWGQAVRAEVYALESALIAGALAAVLAHTGHPARGGRPRALALAGLLSGLALAHHHLIAILFLIPAAAILLARPRRERPSPRLAAVTALLGLLGLAAFAYLPVRASRDPLVNFADPDVASRFAWTVSARAFQKSAGGAHVSPPAVDAAEVTWALVEQSTPVLFAAALIAGYLALRAPGAATPAPRRPIALLVGVAVTSAAGRVLVGFDPGTPDHLGYLLPAVIAIALLGAAGAAGLAHAIAATAPRAAAPLGWAAAAAIALIVPWQLARHGGDASQRRAHASDALARTELEALPPRALSIVSYFQTSFRAWGLRATEAARPDVALLDRSFSTYPGFDQEARRRHPDLAPLVDAPLRAGAPTPVAALGRVAAARPVALQLHINLDDEALAQLVPEGAHAWFRATPPTGPERTGAEQLDLRARAALAAAMSRAAAAGDRDAAAEALLWIDVMRARLYCHLGRTRAAAAAIAAARATAPDDLLLEELAARCLTAP